MRYAYVKNAFVEKRGLFKQESPETNGRIDWLGEVQKSNRKDLIQKNNCLKGPLEGYEASQSGYSREKILSGIVQVKEIINYLASDSYMSKLEAAGYLGISLRTLQSLLPQIPHYRLGGKILIKRSELDRWMQRYRESSNSLDEMIEDAAQDLVSGWKGSQRSARKAPPNRRKFTREQFERAKPFLSEALRIQLEAEFAAGSP